MDKRNTFFIIFGLIFSALAFFSMSMGIIGVLAAWAFGTFAGICFASVLAPKIGEICGCSVYTPLDYLKKAPEKIACVKGLIEQEKYPEAIAALNDVLARNPYDPQSYLLLVEIYMDRLDDKNQTAELIEKYFQNPKLKALPENVEFMLRYSDICLAGNSPEAAIALFRRELGRKGYSAPEARSLTLRLEALTEKVES